MTLYTPDTDKRIGASLLSALPSQRESGWGLAGRALSALLLIVAAMLLPWLGWNSAVGTQPAGQAVVPTEQKGGRRAVATIGSMTPMLLGAVWEKQEGNADTVGWLVVPGTDIDQVIVQNPFELGNAYYLTHNFYGEADRDGMFCADRRIEFGSGTRSELPMMTTIYGHSWDDNPEGPLFSQLKRYRDSGFAAEHPYLFFSTSGEDMAWEVFAVFDTTVDLPYVWPELPEDVFDRVMDVVYRSSLYDYGISVSPEDRILTLSTCTFDAAGHSLPLDEENDYRFVVMARLADPDDVVRKSASLVVNDAPLSPDDLPEVLMPWQDSRIENA